MSKYSIGYIACNKYMPYYVKNTSGQNIFSPFQTHSDSNPNYIYNSAWYAPFGILIKTDKRQCIHQFHDKNGNLCCMYYTNGNTQTKTVSTDPNATLCQDKYNQTPQIPDRLAYNLVVTDNGDGYYTEGSGFIFTKYGGNNKRAWRDDGIRNTALDLSNINFKVSMDVALLWNFSNTTVDSSAFNTYANYKYRNDLWWDSGQEITVGLWNRFNNAVTTPNWVNGEFVNTEVRANMMNGLEFIGLYVDVLDGNSNNDSSNTAWMEQNVHADEYFLANKYEINVSELPLIDNVHTVSRILISNRIDDIREYTNVKPEVVTYNIPICNTIQEVRAWLDDGILPDGWNPPDEDDDIDTSGESDPNENDNVEDNQGTTPSNLSLHGIDLYLLEGSDIATFKSAFFDFDLTNSVINKFTGLYSGLENYVVGLKYYPCGLPSLSTGTSTVKVGNLQLELNDTPITLKRINGYHSSILYTGTLQLPEYYHSILDYGGYNKAWLYLPYYGTVPIDVSILRTRTLKVVYTLDIVSGSATIILYIGNSSGYTPMNIYSCEMGCDIPMTLQSGIELGTKVVDLSTNVLTATIGGATGGAVGAIVGGLQSVTNGVDLSNMTQVCGRSNSLAMQGAPLYPSLLLMKPKYPKNYQGSYGNLVGKPACITTTLTSGYNKVLDGKPNINGCTQSEYDKIVSLLNEGVWI